MRISDWSSDVCSSDLSGLDDADLVEDRHRVEVDHDLRLGVPERVPQPDDRAVGQPGRVVGLEHVERARRSLAESGGGGHGLVRDLVDVEIRDRKRVVWGKSVSVRVDLGGRRTIKKKTKTKNI